MSVLLTLKNSKFEKNERHFLATRKLIVQNFRFAPLRFNKYEQTKSFLVTRSGHGDLEII